MGVREKVRKPAREPTHVLQLKQFSGSVRERKMKWLPSLSLSNECVLTV